jgi:hypothetical protein
LQKEQNRTRFRNKRAGEIGKSSHQTRKSREKIAKNCKKFAKIAKNDKKFTKIAQNWYVLDHD